jgi:hypothetical protein
MEMVGLTGLEPVTLRLSSACSNQLSYRPGMAAARPNFRISIAGFRFYFDARKARHYLNLKSQIANQKSAATVTAWRQGDSNP